ncbi:contractile injection system protein, VgrG/Pvc8 family [Trinickia dinghuensis]|uniref:Type IV secretion protein Rhs n=1 Tax=Trinickia dinghuensis TaxID=2291023 RepID=A0A3D8JPU6_9BURK|nr:contractile injection system protein, VgrG/Pvc8 family [Trinickia dinghuensis]RDU94736.1 type IV secretion protein Rhs [Trinickia dinghuensis]
MSDATLEFSVDRLAAPEPLVFLHCAIFVDRNTILGAETFRLESFQGQESISELFEFQLELSANSDGQNPVSFRFDQLVGRPITVGIGKQGSPDANASDFKSAIGGQAAAGSKLSLFNGIVTSFAVKNRGSYSITMKPALQRLCLTNHYVVFHRKTVWEMIRTLLDAHNIAYAPFMQTQDNLAVIRRQDWMQAGETDFDFLKRLMGKALLYFYFVHTGAGHLVVFSNQPRYPDAVPGGRPLRYTFTDAQALGLEQEDIVTEFSMKKTLGSTGVQGVLTQQDGAWLHNSIVRFHSYFANEGSDANPLPFNLYKSYQYGGSTDEAQILSTATQSTLDGSHNELSGASNCVSFRVGHRFTLRSGGTGPTDPIEPFLDSGIFVLSQVSHQASADGGYKNQFQAGDASFLVTPYSIQSTQQGSVLAEVMSGATAPGQNPVDFGAVSSFSPAQSSFVDVINGTPSPQIGVYVRLSTAAASDPHVWVKLSSSMQTAPTIGSIVLVSRAQDESELPEIQNVIQTNGSELVVPSGWLSNTHVGSNYSTNYGDNQSINYGKYSTPDLNQATRIVTSAYQTSMYDNVSFSQGTSYSFSCADSLAPSASSNPAELYGPGGATSDIVNASESFGSSYSRQSGNTTNSYSHFDQSFSNSWVQTEESTRYAGNSVSVSTGLTSTSTTTLGASTTNTNIGVSTNVSTTGQTFTTSISGDVVENITVGDTIRTSTNGNLTETSVTGNTTRDSTSGNIVETSVTGNTVRTSTSGNITETSITGDTVRTSTSGAITETSITGDVDRNSTSGDVTEISLSGNVTRTTTSGTVEETTTMGGVTRTTVNGEVVSNDVKGSETATDTAGDSTRINTSGATTNIVTQAESTEVETAGPGARVTNYDETPHIDNIVTRILMIEATVIFM